MHDRLNESLSLRRRENIVIAVLVASGMGLIGLSLGVTASAASSPLTITVAHYATWGPTMTLKNGDTLYRLNRDSKDKSTCNAQCTITWLPVLLPPGQKSPIGIGLRGLGSFTRANGERQVTYEGIPLYRFAGDGGPGKVTGNLTTQWGRWWSINPRTPGTPPHKSVGSTTTTTTVPTTGAPTTTTTVPYSGY